MTGALLDVVSYALQIYYYVVIAAVVASWLVAFGVIETRNSLARRALLLLHTVTEPVFRVIRRIVPIIGGFDFSPLIVLIIIYFLQRLLFRLYFF